MNSRRNSRATAPQTPAFESAEDPVRGRDSISRWAVAGNPAGGNDLLTMKRVGRHGTKQISNSRSLSSTFRKHHFSWALRRHMAISDPIIEPRLPASDDQWRTAQAQANLALWDALLKIEDDVAARAGLFEAVRAVFRNEHALLLEDRDDELECTLAEPQEHIGRRWSKQALQNILNGRILVGGGGARMSRLSLAFSDFASPTQPMLSIPIAVAGKPALLLLLRAQGRELFDDESVAIARQCAVIALAALAARYGGLREAEIQRLSELVEKLRRGEQSARMANRLLQELMDHLPIGITVQDANSRFIMVNATAAANLAMPADVLVGASPADFLPEEEAAQRRQWEIDLLKLGKPVAAEERVNDGTGEHTWLTSHRPIHIYGQTLLLSSSLDITERKQFERQLARRAHYDELTGLPNRVLIQQQVEQLIERKENRARFAFVFINIDNFKHINDYYSHTVGDLLLVHIARRIRNRLRDSDTLAHISGDEFLLIIDPAADDQFLRATIAQILQDLKQPFHIKSFEIFTSASIGISIYPDHGTSYEVLRRSADNALYRAKHTAKGESVYFDSSMGETIAARMEIEQRLRLAIRDRRFCCAFQPKVDIQTQEVVGFETLVRWRDDDGEIHPPGNFIGLAIELGLIDPITNFVLAEAIGAIERLDDAFGSGTSISINVASKQAGDMNFMRPFMESLKASQYADRIMLELTEDAFTTKSQFQTQVLPVLRDIGVRVSIDDFGTGFSSLSVLADITADEVKVDRSFITDIHRRPRNQSILRAIESLGHALGMSIIAEGVESFEELTYLRTATRIRYAQGFYFSRPLYLDELTATRNENLSGRAVQTARERPEGRGDSEHRTSAMARSRSA
jgi:diguanylate cyclase (GGDEF)-like protein/PAS domain S-box-containing protein